MEHEPLPGHLRGGSSLLGYRGDPGQLGDDAGYAEIVAIARTITERR